MIVLLCFIKVVHIGLIIIKNKKLKKNANNRLTSSDRFVVYLCAYVFYILFLFGNFKIL